MRCRGLTGSAVPGLHGYLAAGRSVLELEHRATQHAGPVRVTAGLGEGGRVRPGDLDLDGVRHVAGADVLDPLADRGLAEQDPRRARRVVAVDDLHPGVLGVAGEL